MNVFGHSTFHVSGYSVGQVVSTSASHQCGLGSIPDWGSDPGAVSEKGLSSPI